LIKKTGRARFKEQTAAPCFVLACLEKNKFYESGCILISLLMNNNKGLLKT